ncbi:ornithine-acyl[acyl carrier protein] N-acyltransferase [Litoreibacter meonggei]|uniref:L-ornithine N(alpha)-acyltransferase n=1 Tax=Litoreibacter meonggei TaxID=1049199 RepID=A0A497WQY3_9RHOB|nr:GNAT family N-acetyltransferase [Litoreibacter meonggei]RLJ58982.1 ornithine-acyl[acyl carrier protein] N-acyltransferase [Litoreibacter meonggei]
MPLLSKGRYVARFADGPADVEAAQRLRALAFRDARVGLDKDAFDALCLHMLVEDQSNGALVCSFRLMPLDNGRGIEQSYSAQHYGLAQLAEFDGAMVEMGRFCVHPDYADPDILRVAWGALTKYVDDAGIEMLFGCSSFKGTSEDAYLDAFSLLKDRHLGPKRWLPRVKAPFVFPFARKLRLRRPDLKAAMKAMPPLLRTYLLMGGWVSDHAVVDRDMNTLHVFTGLEIKAIPPARKKLLRVVAG